MRRPRAGSNRGRAYLHDHRSHLEVCPYMERFVRTQRFVRTGFQSFDGNVHIWSVSYAQNVSYGLDFKVLKVKCDVWSQKKKSAAYFIK